MNQNPFNNQAKPAPKKSRQPQNFVEALKSIGGHTVKSLTNDVIKPILPDAFNSITGSQSQSQESTQPPAWNKEWLQPQDTNQEVQRQLRHREVIQTQVFDRRQEEIKAQIKALREELKALAGEIAALAQNTQQAIEAEIENPGTYHVSFFEKLKRSLILLRKQVAESQNWLELSYQRRQSKNAYWSGFKKSGTKFSMSHERAIATSAG
jgi:hypothetical protein